MSFAETKKMGKVQDDKLQGSEHVKSTLRKEIYVNPYRESNTEGLEGSETGLRDTAIFNMDLKLKTWSVLFK